MESHLSDMGSIRSGQNWRSSISIRCCTKHTSMKLIPSNYSLWLGVMEISTFPPATKDKTIETYRNFGLIADIRRSFLVHYLRQVLYKLGWCLRLK